MLRKKLEQVPFYGR